MLSSLPLQHKNTCSSYIYSCKRFHCYLSPSPWFLYLICFRYCLPVLHSVSLTEQLQLLQLENTRTHPFALVVEFAAEMHVYPGGLGTELFAESGGHTGGLAMNELVQLHVHCETFTHGITLCSQRLYLARCPYFSPSIFPLFPLVSFFLSSPHPSRP